MPGLCRIEKQQKKKWSSQRPRAQYGRKRKNARYAMYDDERMELVRWVGWGVGPGGETCPFLMASICFDRFLCSLCACSCVLDHRTSYKISLCAPILVLVSPCEATLVMVGGRCGLPASSGCYSILGILLLCFFSMVSHDY